RRQSRHHVAGSLLQRGLFPVNRTGNAVRDSASEPDNGGQLLLQTSEQTSHDRLTSRYQQDAVVREGTLNGLNLRSDARGETNHVTESRLHTGLEAVHNRGALRTQGKAHLPANVRSGTSGPTDSLTGPRSDPAYETAPRTVRTVPSLVL